ATLFASTRARPVARARGEPYWSWRIARTRPPAVPCRPMSSHVLPVSLGERIRLIRTGRGMTQQDLAEQCGITAEFLGRIERQRAMPSLQTLLRLVSV